MEKNMQKRLIMLLMTATFVLTIMGASTAATYDTDVDVSDVNAFAGEPTNLTAQLTYEVSGPNPPLAGQTIDFYVDSTWMGSNSTNATGHAIFSINAPSGTGNYDIWAYFRGNTTGGNTYRSDWGHGDLSVYRKDLTVTKTSNTGNTAYVGETVIYTIAIQNNRPSSTVRDVEVRDVLPLGVTFVSASNGGTYNPATRTVSWTGANDFDIPGGQTYYRTITVLVNSAQLGQYVTNYATANHRDCRVLSSRSNDVTFLIPNFSVTKTDNPDPVIAGNTLTYTITITNNGQTNAGPVTFADVLPAALTNTEYSINNVNWYTYNSGQVVGLVAFGPAESRTVWIRGTVDPATLAGTITNTVNVYVDGQQSAQASAATTVNRQAALIVTKTVEPSNYNVGNTVTYYLTVTNNGPSTATNVVVTDTVPTGLTFVSATNGGTESGGVITWTIPTLAVNGQFTPSFTATVNAGTQGQTIPNTASAYNNENPTPVTSDPANIYVNNPILEIFKSTDRNPANYNVGENVIYTITVDNESEDLATGTVVTDTLPAGLIFVSATNGGVWDANTRTITWNVGNLANQFTATVTATVTSEAAGKTLVNTATVDADQLDNALTTTASIYVPSADLVLTKTVDKTKPTVKDTVVFTLIVNNHGPDAAVNVTVNDKLPAGLTYVSHVANFGTYDPVTGLWTIASLPNGASAVLTITAVVEQTGQIINQANVTALTWDPNLEGNAASAAMDVQAEPVPVSGKTVAMQKTGAPIFGLLLAFFMLVAGMVLPRRK